MKTIVGVERFTLSTKIKFNRKSKRAKTSHRRPRPSLKGTFLVGAKSQVRLGQQHATQMLGSSPRHFSPQETPTKARNYFSLSRLVSTRCDAADWSCIGFDPIPTITRKKHVFGRVRAGHVLDFLRSAELSYLRPIISSFIIIRTPI